MNRISGKTNLGETTDIRLTKEMALSNCFEYNQEQSESIVKELEKAEEVTERNQKQNSRTTTNNNKIQYLT